MPVSKDLFSDDDRHVFRKWCRFQLYDMPPTTQEEVITALRTIIRRDAQGKQVLKAMGVDLPGVGLDYQEAWEMQKSLRKAEALLIFRFYTGQPDALIPARFFQMGGHTHSELVNILRVHETDAFAPRNEPAHDSRGRPTGPKGRRWGSSMKLVALGITPKDMLQVSPYDLKNIVGATDRDLMVIQDIQDLPFTLEKKAECWMAYKHQTGRRDNSPYLSCTAVMPRMVRSGSKTLRVHVMPQAPYLGLFLVPKKNFLVQWVHRKNTELMSVVHSVEEIEVLYKTPPQLQDFQLLRFPNPFSEDNGGHRIPAAQSPGEVGTSKLSTTADPGYAADHVPGLVFERASGPLALN
jgi:hypothetical protein